MAAHVSSRPVPAAMAAADAQWVREQVWPTTWLRNYQHIPGTFTDCACHRPPSVACQRGNHQACRHDGHPINETVVQTSGLTPARLPHAYAHPSPVRSGINDLAWVWPAERPCRELCTCRCHQERAPAVTSAPPEIDIEQPPVITRPIAATATWETVIVAAGGMCQCTGACGSRHTTTAMRCDRTQDVEGIRLVTAPTDLTLRPHEAAAVPVAELRAWCPRCHTAARRRQTATRRATAQYQQPSEGLFDLEPPAAAPASGCACQPRRPDCHHCLIHDQCQDCGRCAGADCICACGS